MIKSPTTAATPSILNFSKRLSCWAKMLEKLKIKKNKK